MHSIIARLLRWLKNLPPRSIYDWDQFCEQFIANFRSTCLRPATERSLARIQQGRNECLKSFVRRFSELKNQTADVPDHVVITHFKSGLRDEKLLDKLARKPPTSVESLFDVSNKYANAQEETTDILLHKKGRDDKPRDPRRDDHNHRDDRRDYRRGERREGRRGGDRTNRRWERKRHYDDDVNAADYDNKRTWITIEDALDKQCPLQCQVHFRY